jgi:hypothetical protein
MLRSADIVVVVDRRRGSDALGGAAAVVGFIKWPWLTRTRHVVAIANKLLFIYIALHADAGRCFDVVSF